MLEIMQHLRQQGFEKSVTTPQLFKAIGFIAGMSEDTRSKYFRLLKEFHFIENLGESEWQLNYDKVFELE